MNLVELTAYNLSCMRSLQAFLLVHNIAELKRVKRFMTFLKMYIIPGNTVKIKYKSYTKVH